MTKLTEVKETQELGVSVTIRVNVYDFLDLMDQREALSANLAATQRRCNELLAENRELRARWEALP